MKSLRWRLVIGILAGISLIAAIGGYTAYSVIRSGLYEEFDRGLVERAIATASFIEMDEGRVKIEWLDDGLEYPRGHDPASDFLQVWNATGEVLAVSREMGDLPLPRIGGTLQSPTIRKIRLPGGREGRCVGMQFSAIVDPDEIAEGADPVGQPVDLAVKNSSKLSIQMLPLEHCPTSFVFPCLCLHRLSPESERTSMPPRCSFAAGSGRMRAVPGLPGGRRPGRARMPLRPAWISALSKSPK